MTYQKLLPALLLAASLTGFCQQPFFAASCPLKYTEGNEHGPYTEMTVDADIRAVTTCWPVLQQRIPDPPTEPRYSELMNRYFVLKDAIAQAADLKTLQSLQMQLDDVNEKLSEANIAALHEHTAQFQALLPAMTAVPRPKRRHWWRLR